MKSWFIFAALCISSAAALFAQPSVSLTIYNKDLAVVRDVRVMTFPAGVGTLSVTDVPAQLDPTTVHLQADGIELIEQNYDCDLVSPERLAQKYVGHEIELASKSGTVTQGTLLSVSGYRDNAQILIQQSDGVIRSMFLADAAEIRFPKLPDGLIMVPTLRWKTRSAAQATKETEISYATSGMSWYADYILTLNTEGSRGRLSAWVSLSNNCGIGFDDAELQLVAGELHRVGGPRAGMLTQESTSHMANLMSTRSPEEQALFEYHLYTVQGRTDLGNHQTKQISLFPDATTTVTRKYEYDRDGLVLQPENTKAPMFVCCCCGCCCGVLRSAKRLPQPADFFSSNFYAVADTETCESCGVCETRCQMEAISSPEGKAVVDRSRCIGCALCLTTCPSGALRLQAVDHPKEPPDDTKALYMKLFEDRFGRWGMAKLGARKLLGMKI